MTIVLPGKFVTRLAAGLVISANLLRFVSRKFRLLHTPLWASLSLSRFSCTALACLLCVPVSGFV